MSLRNPKPWEVCSSPKSMVGVHLWHLESRVHYNESSGMAKNDAKPEDIIVCKICKQRPPNVHRGTIERHIQEQLEAQKESRRLARLYKPTRKR